MNLAFRRHQIRISGLSIALKKTLGKLRSELRLAREFSRTRKEATTLADRSPAAIRPLFSIDAIDGLAAHRAELDECVAHYLQHEFPIAGSGWTALSHTSPVKGIGGFRYKQEEFPYEFDEDGEWIGYLVNTSNIKESQRVWLLIEKPYEPIDWQRDMRSGYTWSEGQYAAGISTGNGKGVDPKTPWDLGRLHFLLHLAAAHSLSNDAERQLQLWSCFRSLCLDFISLNPPGFGIQWKSAMDVAIRLANMLVALDIVRLQREADADFTSVFTRSVHEHARYVLTHLEWSDGMRANHYLANLAGLSAAAAYLEDCPLRSEIISLLRTALPRETHYQFNNDGGNFEASLPYHRLSAEMLVWSWVFVENCEELHDLIHTPAVAQALERIANFSLNTASSSGTIPQIGDNDSGRFLPLLPFHWTPQQNERPLNIRHLLNTFEALSLPDAQSVRTEDQGELAMLRSLRMRAAESATAQHKLTSVFPAASLHPHFAAEDFGLWHWSNETSNGSLELFLRAGSIGQNGKGGHAHNDQLSVCVFVNGLEFFCDPGTYVYTALPDERNRFRSTAMHNCLQLESMEQNTWSVGTTEMLFWLTSDRARVHVSNCTDHGAIATHQAYGLACSREIAIDDSGVSIHDKCASSQSKSLRFHLRPECKLTPLSVHKVRIERGASILEVECASEKINIEQSLYSPEYGAVLATACLVITTQAQDIDTRLTVVKA